MKKKKHLGPKRCQMRRLGPFCLRGPVLAFVGRHWLLWAFVDLRWLLWAFVDLRWPSLAVVGCRGPVLACVGCCGLLWACVGLWWPLVAVVGCYGPLLSIKWKKKLYKKTPRAQTTPDASFGPFFVFVGLR